MKIIKFWQWPNGLLWKIILPRMHKSRQKRYALFIKTLNPQKSDKILDVGVGEGFETALNFLEEWYPYSRNITALGLEDLPSFKKKYPSIQYIKGDGRKLPFKNKSFDIYFSNAVLEHVGYFEQQKKFIKEACRVAPKVFISTPNRWFPIDLHTLIPLAHFFPEKIRSCIYHFFGKHFYALEEHLRLTHVGEIKKMLPKNVKLKVYPQKFLGMTINLNLVITRK
ncbi:MAG TPA: class I SAM-dependent methyltransferase [bacterium]|nr:class I SAM-dependent methyltransferase [bacterium]